MAEITSGGPLSSLRVLELGYFVAAPFAARLLGGLGTDIIKSGRREAIRCEIGGANR